MSTNKVLTQQIAEQFCKQRYSNINLSKFTEIEDAASLILGAKKTSRRDNLDLSGLRSLSEKAAQNLVKFKGGLNLSGIVSLNDKIAQILIEHGGKIDLDGSTILNDSTAKILSNHKGEILLHNLKQISEAATKYLTNCSGIIQIPNLKISKSLNYPNTRLLQVCLTKAGKDSYGNRDNSNYLHISKAIPPKGEFTDAPKEWKDGNIKFHKNGNLWDKGENYLNIAVRWHWSDFLGDQRKARKWFYEKLSDDHSHISTSSRFKYVISPEAFSLWMDHEGFWIAHALDDLNKAKKTAQKNAAVPKLKVFPPKQEDREPPSEKVLSAKEVGKLRILIKTKQLSKIRFVCETLDTLDATPNDWIKLFPKTRIKELVKHAHDKEKLEILEALAGAFEPYSELFHQLQLECEDQFKYGYGGNFPLPKNHGWARIVASTKLLSGLQNLGDDEISLFLAEATAADPNLWLGNLITISEDAANLMAVKAENLSFGGGLNLSTEVAEALSKFKGSLSFQLSEIDDEVANVLAKYEGNKLELGYHFKWKDTLGHIKLAKTVAKNRNVYESFQYANSLPLEIIKEFALNNDHLNFDFDNETISTEKLALLRDKCLESCKITLQSFRIDLETAQELSKCKAASMELHFWTSEKTGLLDDGVEKKDIDLKYETDVIDSIMPYQGELQLNFQQYGGFGVDKAQKAFECLIESKLKERKEALQKKIKQKSLSSASLPPDVDQVEAERKIERLKDVLHSEDAGELGLILLAAADSWMVELISAGMKVADGDVLTNEYFETAENEKVPIGFWLAYARAVEEGFHAKSLHPVKKIVLHLDSEQALRIMEEEILPRLTFLEELTLTLTKEAGIFCTGSLPSMSKLKTLTIVRASNHVNRAVRLGLKNYWGDAVAPIENELSLTDLKRQSSLEEILLVNPTSLAIEDPKPFLSKIELQGSYIRDDYGKITQNNAKSLRRINSGALKVLIFNQLDHSKSKKAPAWWQDDLSSDPVVAEVFGAVETAEVNPYSNKDFISLIDFKSGKKRIYKIPIGHEVTKVGRSKWEKMSDWVFPGEPLSIARQDQWLDLSGIEKLTDEMIAQLCNAPPVRLRSDAIKGELAVDLLSSRKKPIELVGGSASTISEILPKLKCRTTLDLANSKLGKSTISAMKKFAGDELTIFFSGILTDEQATCLASLTFPIVLACKENNNIEISDNSASIIAKRDVSTKLSFDRSIDLYGGGNPDHFRISKLAIDQLQQNKNFDLGLFGPTVLVKENRYMNLSIYQEQGKDKMTLEILSGVYGGARRVSTKSGNVYDKKKKIVEQLLKGYQFA